MNFPRRIPLERAALAASLAGVLAGGVWAWRQQPALAALRRAPAPMALTGTAYVRVAWPAPTAAPSWTKPRAQSPGAGWVYEVFTPPVIYYHAVARSFAVTPPEGIRETSLAFGLELLDVKRELYRLQLVGYVGDGHDCMAAFTSPESPETFLARTGQRFGELGLTLAKLEVRRVHVGDDSALTAYDLAAFATLRDERSGADVTLDSRARRFTDTPLAVLRLRAGAAPREMREGDAIEDDAVTYRIERIQLDPPEVIVAKRVAGLPYPETRVLKPLASDPVAPNAPASVRRFNQPSQPGVAASGNPR